MDDIHGIVGVEDGSGMGGNYVAYNLGSRFIICIPRVAAL